MCILPFLIATFSTTTRSSSAVDDTVASDVTTDIPSIDQPTTSHPELSGSGEKNVDEVKQKTELLEEAVAGGNRDDEETSVSLSSSEFPSSCFELRPKEACLYAVFNEGTTLETELFKMTLTDEQMDQIGEIFLSPDSFEQLLLIVPEVQEFADEGVSSFKVMSAIEPDDSRSSFIISSSAPLSGSSSSSSKVSISTMDF